MSVIRNQDEQPDVESSSTVADGAYCPYFHHVVELIGRRWTGAILLVLSRGPMRFSHLRQQIPGLSDRLLTERIGELEHEGIVERLTIAGHGTYGLSEKGRGLRPILEAIEAFAHASAMEQTRPSAPGRRSPAQLRHQR